jgi:hypothetical protein
MDDWHAALRKEMIAQPPVVPDLQDEVPYRDGSSRNVLGWLER